MAWSFEDLKRNRPKLQPVPVPIEGIDEPVLIHQFTLSELESFGETNADEDPEKTLRTNVLRLLKGFGQEITDEDRASLSEIFAGWQLRQIFTAGLKLNGQGPAALREAEKN